MHAVAGQNRPTARLRRVGMPMGALSMRVDGKGVDPTGVVMLVAVVP